MATTSQNLETIANNVAAIAKESAAIFDKMPIEQTINRYITNNYSGYTFDFAKLIGDVGLTTGASTSTLPILYLYGDFDSMSKEVKSSLTYKFGLVDGQYISGTCQCKWQGNTAWKYPKKAFTLSKVSPKLNLLNWGEQKKFVLKAEYLDSSFARNTVCAQLWGEIVNSRTGNDAITAKLKSCPNGGAVDGFPIMLVINDSFHGVYNFNIPKDDWMQGMGDGEREAIIPCEGIIGAAWLREIITKEQLDAEQGFSVKYVSDEANYDWVVTSLNNLIQYVIDNQSNSSFKAGLEELIDTQSVIDYIIFAHLIGHWDGIGHNYVLSTYDGTKWFITAYDMDNTFGVYSAQQAYTISTYRPRFTQINENLLFRLFVAYDRSAIKTRYNELKQGCLNENNILFRFSNYISGIPKLALDAEFELWPHRFRTNCDHLAQVYDWYCQRCKYFEDSIASW